MPPKPKTTRQPTRRATDVKPLPGLAAWVGGKKHLAGRLVERIERIPHTCYAEPFMGMGGVFFRRRSPAKVEVLNDINSDVVNLFRIVQRHPHALAACMRFALASRADFIRLKKIDPASLTDVERAARFFYLCQASFGGKAEGGAFGISPLVPPRFSAHRLRTTALAAHRRLHRVCIEQLPYEKFIERWDRPSTLFYLDPPYWGSEHYYGRDRFKRADFDRISSLLRGIKGRFILTLNDLPEVRQMFAWAHVEAEEVTYRLGGAKRVGELVISND